MMFRIALLALVAGLAPCHAQQFTALPFVCPQGQTTAGADGCNGQPIGGNVQFANFFSSRALQSGQTYATRPPWNVAGVDYPVGIPAASFPLKVPGVDTPPNGCSLNVGHTFMTCQSVTNPLIDGWDSTNVAWEFKSTVTGTITFKNTKIANGAGSNVEFEMVLVDSGGSANLVFSNNTCDGGAPTLFHVIRCVHYSASGNYSGSYNSYSNFEGVFLQLGGGAIGAVTEKFSYGESINTCASGQHGEWDILPFTGTMSLFSFSYNVFLEPALSGCADMTASIYLSGGSANGSGITAANIDHNTLSVNWRADTMGPTSSVAGVEWAYIGVTTTNLTANYIDPTGALLCFSDAGGGGTRTTINYSGNINLRDASTISDATAANCHGHQ